MATAKFKIDHGTVTLNGVLYPLFDSTLQTYADGKRFVLRDSSGISMFGTYIPSTTAKDFRVKANIWDGTHFVSETYRIAQIEKPIVIEQPKQETPKTQTPITESVKSNKQLEILIKNPLLGYKERDYTFTARVFDKAQNPTLDFYSSSGLITNAKITGKLQKPDGSTLTVIEGNTNEQGYFQSSSFIPFTAPLNGAYTLVLSALVNFPDNTFATTTATKTFFVEPEPHDLGTGVKVTVNAGPDQPGVPINSPVTLSGSGSSSNGNPVTFQWIQIAGTAVVLSDPTVSSPTFTSPGSAQTLTFQLTVSNGIKSATDTVNIDVT